MNLYKLSAEQPFLETIADFIINHFKRYDQLKVILPNGFACLNLQRILVNKKGALILPTIIPFLDITGESEEIFKVPSENLGCISYLEEKLILAEIINGYPKLKFNINQSLKFSTQLSNLFQELIYNNISIESIKDLPTLHQAEHWQFIYEFLIYAYNHWQEEISTRGKINRAYYRINMLELEINRLKQDSASSLIVAGIFGNNKISWNFLKTIAKLPNGFLILSPISSFLEEVRWDPTNDSPEEDPLYCLKRLLETLNINLLNFRSLNSPTYHESWLDSLIIEKPLAEPENYVQEATNKIKYNEFDDVFQEAEAIALICQKHYNKKIALIINNDQNKEIYSNFLSKYSLEFHDLFGCNLAKTNASHLIIVVSDILCSGFDIKKIFILLKNPLINSHFVTRLEKLIKGSSRFVASWDQLSAIVQKANDLELLDWYQNLCQLLSNVPSLRRNFNNLLKVSIRIAEKLCSNLWLDNKASALADFFAELMQLNWNFTLNDITTFPEIIRSLIAGARFFDNDPNPTNIIICNPENAAMLKFDVVILADFSEGNWPPAQSISPWLNKQMGQELELYSKAIASGLCLYNFYLLLHNDKVIITRSKKQGGSASLLPSSYILKLQFILDSLYGKKQLGINDHLR